MIALGWSLFLGVIAARPAHGQGGQPLTNLGPVQLPPTAYGQANPPAATGLAPLSGAGSSFDPYGSTGSGLFGSSSSNNLGSGFAGATVTPMGPPIPMGSPSVTAGATLASPGVGASVGNPAYPNGSLLGGLFSGSWFGGGSTAAYPSGPLTATPYQGAGYATPGFPPTTYNTPSYVGPSYSAPPVGYDSGTGLFPPSAYPSGSPSSLFPGGLSASGNTALFPSGLIPAGSPLANFQFVRGPRLRHTYITGGDAVDEVGMNQTDVSIGFAFPNFLFSTRPLFIVPSFSLYLFDGPISTVGSPRDLPANAYGGFVDFGWQTDANQIIGAELGVRVGAFTDFDTFNDDSVRVMGKGLISFRLTPSSTIKGGVYYLDRYSIKMLPAGGWLWQPDPYTRFDVFFPEPKFAKYWRTIGTQDVWWYLAGEYGGDSWTISRAIDTFANEERVDLNQIAVTFGFEWGRSDLIRTGRRSAFMEAGVVFDRELEYEISPHDRTLDEAFLLRAGIGY